MSEKRHWTEDVFKDKASSFMPILTSRAEKAENQIDAIQDIFNKHDVAVDSKILDLACGIGRHSVELASKGYQVVGVDISKKYLGIAQELAESRKVSDHCQFIQGDMRNIKGVLHSYLEGFDVIVNLFTSFGYYDDETDRKILREIRDLVRKGGLFIIDIMNRDYFIRNIQSTHISNPTDEHFHIEETSLDLENSRLHAVWKIYKPVGDDLEFQETISIDNRLFSLHELKSWLEDAGWRYLEVYGGFDLSPLTFDSKRMIVVAQNQ